MAERVIADRAIHATAVAIGGEALLLLGPSKSGKSRLAVALVAASRARRRIELVGDDRVLLRRTAGGLEARPHPRIAGFMERRGLGLVATAWRTRAPVAGVAALGAVTDAAEAWLADYPTLHLAQVEEAERCGVILAWWRDLAPGCDAKAAPPLRLVGQD